MKSLLFCIVFNFVCSFAHADIVCTKIDLEMTTMVAAPRKIILEIRNEQKEIQITYLKDNDGRFRSPKTIYHETFEITESHDIPFGFEYNGRSKTTGLPIVATLSPVEKGDPKNGVGTVKTPDFKGSHWIINSFADDATVLINMGDCRKTE